MTSSLVPAVAIWDWIDEIRIPRQLRQGFPLEAADEAVHVELAEAALHMLDGHA